MCFLRRRADRLTVLCRFLLRIADLPKTEPPRVEGAEDWYSHAIDALRYLEMGVDEGKQTVSELLKECRKEEPAIRIADERTSGIVWVYTLRNCVRPKNPIILLCISHDLEMSPKELKLTAEPLLINGCEKRFIVVWTLVLLSVMAVPICHGYIETPPGEEFMGFSDGGVVDYNAYLAWMRQAEQGHLLFKDMFTTEPGGVRTFFHPLFWSMGTLARLTGASLLSIWYAVHAIGLRCWL